MLFIFVMSGLLFAHDQQIVDSTLSLTNSVKKQTSITCVCTSESPELLMCAKRLQQLVECTGQMEMVLRNAQQPTSKTDIKNDAGQTLCVLYLSMDEKEPSSILWRLYESLDGTMLGGKRCRFTDVQDGSLIQHLGHWLWTTLFNNPGPFGSYIAYIACDDQSRFQKHYSLRYCWWNGSGEHTTLLTTQQPILCPVWNMSLESPSIVYSECTARNVRLMMTNLQGQRRVIIDHSGTFAGVSYAPKGEYVAYCRSGDIWKFRFDSRQLKSVHSMLIHEDVPAGCPQITKNGDIVYCCKGKIKKYHVDEDWSEILTSEGYCVGPSYNAVHDSLVFSKKVKGVLQLFLLDLADNKQRQITFDAGNKVDPVWSPCGTMVAFCHQRDGVTYLTIQNCLTDKRCVIHTTSSQVCCPAWSTYRGLPVGMA